MTDDPDLGPVGQRISAKLMQHFSPQALEVIDESHHHAGHAGANPSGESHFRVRIAAEAFRGQSRVAQHRMVNAVLAEELKSRVHALAIESQAPADAPQLAFASLDAGDPRLAALLQAAGLPVDDLSGAAFTGIIDGAGTLLACGGLVVAGDAALIRSVAVAEGRRKGRLGSTITLKLLAEARNSGARAAYLLTTSAAAFFARLGFQPAGRGDVPAALAATSQFTGSRCSAAQVMVQALKPL